MLITRIERIPSIEPIQRITWMKRVKRINNRIKSADIKRVAEIRDTRLGKYIDVTVEGPIHEKNSYCYWA
ncbi:hypothetical protein R84B8_01658 [Treponema sp. R8-4-B8]